MKPAGFTLLEIILVLALVVVVLGLLGMAVDVHLRVTDASRNQVEESQLARLVLQRMGEDLRNAIPVTRAPSSIGGLRGNRQELQVDISRLPMLDGGQATTLIRDNSLPIAPPGDVRTVTYGIAKPGDLDMPDASGVRQPRVGLLRRECERATFAWAVQQGQADDLGRALKVLAPEVEAIEFTYIDGGATYPEWDSAQQGRLPTAVTIAISLRQPRRKAERSYATTATAETTPTVYDTLVYLPNARATLDQTLAAIAKQPATTSQEVKSSDSGSQQTTSQGEGIKEIKPLGSGGSSP